MSHTLAVEFVKTRRRRIWLPVLAILAVQVFWALWALSRWKDGDYTQGWMYYLYQFPLLNCIMMPVAISIVASRLADCEHKGNAFRLLCTIESPGKLFDAKFICGGSYVLLVSLLQVAAIILMGLAFSFGPIPWSHLGSHVLSTVMVGLILYLFQQIFSLLIKNQMVPLLMGLAGGFLGLMTMFFPVIIQKFVLWAYYGVLSTTRMDWDRATRVTSFHWTSYDWVSLAIVVSIFAVLYVLGRNRFDGKEQ